MTARAWSMRRYQPGDERDLLALFNRVFGLRRTLEHWKWQFERNPYAPPTIIVARRDADGLLAGSHVLMPVALSVSGERVLAGHTLDLVVHEDFRRQRLFETTARECFDWALERGIKAVIAFPNAQSYPGFVRSLGWSRITELDRWDQRIGVRRVLGEGTAARAATFLPDLVWRRLAARGRGRAGAGWAVETSPVVFGDHDALWNECATQFAVALWKDREYMAWRYDANPDHPFEYVGLRHDGRLRAIAVLWRERGRVMICDWLVPAQQAGAIAPRLVGATREHARALGEDRLSFVGHDGGTFAGAFSGFRRRRAEGMILTGRGLEEGELDRRVRDAASWTVCYGDADYV